MHLMDGQTQGSYGQEKSENFEGVWESQGKQRVREKSGNFKIPLTRPIIYALFSQLLSVFGGFAPRPLGLRPCKHCRLVYIAIFYNGTKFSITFVYLVFCFTGVANKEISQGKLFILSGKVGENEFCKVVGTLQTSFLIVRPRLH